MSEKWRMWQTGFHLLRQVSRKLLKRDVLYGDDAVAKRLSLNVYRPLEKGR